MVKECWTSQKVPSGIFGGTESDTWVRKLPEAGEGTTLNREGEQYLVLT